MDEIDDAPVAEEAAAIDGLQEDEPAEAQPEAEKPSSKKKGFMRGLLTGAAVGGGAAMLLARLKGEERAPAAAGGAGLGEEGRQRARVALERAEGIMGAILQRMMSAWSAMRERLRAAVEEGKEGVIEGEDEARRRYEFMTKRHRHRRK